MDVRAGHTTENKLTLLTFRKKYFKTNMCADKLKCNLDIPI